MNFLKKPWRLKNEHRSCKAAEPGLRNLRQNVKIGIKIIFLK